MSSAARANWTGLQLENGRYHVHECLGQGGMGEVFRGDDTKLGIPIVIKVPHRHLMEDPLAVTRFRRETRALLSLSHPHIVRVQDLGEHDGLPFIVMQYLPGGSLHDRMQAKRLPMPPEQLSGWLPQVADALDFIHQQGYLHRDVKPHNILFDGAGQAYLGDFGLAKAMGNETVSGAMTASGQVLGTPLYLAPELCRGKNYDGQVDQYALAATVYQWLCGQPPFLGPLAVVLEGHMSQPPPSPLQWVPELPEALAAVVLKGLSKDSRQRFPNCRAFSRAVLAALPASRSRAAPRSSSSVPMRGSESPTVMPTGEGSEMPTVGLQSASSETAAPIPTTGPTQPLPAPRRGAGILLGIMVAASLGLTGVVLGLMIANRGSTLPHSDTGPSALSPKESGKDASKTTETKPQELPPAKASLRLSPIDNLILEAGQDKSLEVRVQRENCKGPIELRLENLPPGVQARPALIPADGDTGRLEVTSNETAAGERQVRLLAVAADTRAESTFRITLTKPLPRQLVVDLGGAVKLELVRIKPGTFLMGSLDADPDAQASELPRHEVAISKDFYLGKYAVTYGQFTRFVQETKYQTEAEKDPKGGFSFPEPSTKPPYTWRNMGVIQTERHPVVNVSWNDAQQFCAWASKQTGRRVELPTEAEWEYACRAGTKTRYFTGDDPDSLEGYANVPDQTLKDKNIKGFENRSYFNFRDGYAYTAPVGSFKPNPWGLYDMTGNVFQWCRDGRRRYTEEKRLDPVGPENDNDRAQRGGSWLYSPADCRCANRGRFEASHRNSHAGFRVLIRLE
jgi:formylglycine-generating enzyme required for sulfatase activity/serine/threonine protein kinase